MYGILQENDCRASDIMGKSGNASCYVPIRTTIMLFELLTKITLILRYNFNIIVRITLFILKKFYKCSVAFYDFIIRIKWIEH